MDAERTYKVLFLYNPTGFFHGHINDLREKMERIGNARFDVTTAFIDWGQESRLQQIIKTNWAKPGPFDFVFLDFDPPTSLIQALKDLKDATRGEAAFPKFVLYGGTSKKDFEYGDSKALNAFGATKIFAPFLEERDKEDITEFVIRGVKTLIAKELRLQTDAPNVPSQLSSGETHQKHHHKEREPGPRKRLHHRGPTAHLHA